MVLADGPFTIVTDVLHIRDLVSCVVGIIGAHTVRTVDLRHLVNRIISIGGHGFGTVGHLCQVVILIVLVADLLPVRISGALQLVTAVISIPGHFAGTAGHPGDAPKSVIFGQCFTGACKVFGNVSFHR